MTCRNRFRPVRHDWGSEAIEGVSMTGRMHPGHLCEAVRGKGQTTGGGKRGCLDGTLPLDGYRSNSAFRSFSAAVNLLRSTVFAGPVVVFWLRRYLSPPHGRCIYAIDRLGYLDARSVSDDGTWLEWLGASSWLRGAKNAPSPHPHHPCYPKLKRPRGTRSETRYRLD